MNLQDLIENRLRELLSVMRAYKATIARLPVNGKRDECLLFTMLSRLDAAYDTLNDSHRALNGVAELVEEDL